MPGSQAKLDPITVGDLRAVSVLVVSSDDSQIISATYTIVRRRDVAGVIWLNGSCAVDKASDGQYVNTATLIQFPTVDTYTVRFQLTWDDGQITNDVSAVVPVQALAN